MYGSPGYTQEGRLYQIKYLSRAMSPRNSAMRSNPRLIDPVLAYSRSSQGTLNVSDFINQVQSQLKRLSPSFSFEYNAEPPLIQATSFLTQAIDFFLDEKSSMSSTDSKNQLENIDDNLTERSKKLRDEIEKARETNKNLNRYENLLKKKEEKFEDERNKFKAEKLELREVQEKLKRDIENFNNQEKLWNDTKKKEQEKIKAEKLDIEKQIMETKDMKDKVEKRIDDNIKHLKYEKESLLQLENCLNQTKQSLSLDQKRITQEKLELEKEKWKLDQRERKIEESEALLKVKLEHLEQEKKLLENEKSNIQFHRKSLEDEKKDLVTLKEQFEYGERDSKLSQIKTPEERSYSARQDYNLYRTGTQDLDQKERDLEEREREIDLAYKTLQEQMDTFNRELEEKEILLDERENYLNRQEKTLTKKHEMVQMTETSLLESRIQIDELKNVTIPQLEKQSLVLESLIQEFNEKKNELEFLCDRLNSEIGLIEAGGARLGVINEYESQEMSRESSNRSPGPAKDINDLAKELESKLNQIKIREEELELAQKNIDSQREEIFATAEFLKKAHLEVENTKKQHEKEINEEKEKLKTQFFKLEAGIRLLSTKEAEIFSFKRKLEERNQMLKIKESNIISKSQSDSQGSSIVEEKFGQ
jgi:hypothetical protein